MISSEEIAGLAKEYNDLFKDIEVINKVALMADRMPVPDDFMTRIIYVNAPPFTVTIYGLLNDLHRMDPELYNSVMKPFAEELLQRFAAVYKGKAMDIQDKMNEIAEELKK